MSVPTSPEAQKFSPKPKRNDRNAGSGTPKRRAKKPSSRLRKVSENSEKAEIKSPSNDASAGDSPEPSKKKEVALEDPKSSDSVESVEVVPSPSLSPSGGAKEQVKPKEEVKSKEIVPAANEGDLALATSPKDIQKYYQIKKEQIRATAQVERERLQKALKILDDDEKTKLLALDKEEKEKIKLLHSPSTITKKKDLRLFKIQVRRCQKAGNMITNLCTKLEVCTIIKEGEVFMDIEEMYRNSKRDPADVFVASHFGYEVDKDLKEYSKKMKVVYCAVASSIQQNKGISAAMKKQMQFSYSAMRYFIKPKEASEKYGSLRESLDIKFVRNVWDLLEDPMTSFFATQFGFAPAMEKMKVNFEVRIPVKAGEIFYRANEEQKKLYRHRSLSSAAFLKEAAASVDNVEKKSPEADSGKSNKKKSKKHSKKETEEKKELEDEDKPDKEEIEISDEPQNEDKPTEEKEESSDKSQNADKPAKEKIELNEEFKAQSAHIALPAGSEDESYLIRCRFLNPFPNPIDPNLLIKTNTRSNFMAKDQNEMKKGPDTLTRIFGKNLTHAKKKRNPLSASGEYETEAEGSENLIIHIHGGGWVSQSPDQHISYVSEWAKMAMAPVISIDYSLSPEAQFPISPNECFAVYKWLLKPENAARLGLSTKPLRIVVCGDSAGGNLTCAVVLKALEAGISIPVGLLLHYPAGILSESGSLSRMIFSNDPILNYQTMKVVLNCYLGDRQSEAKNDYLISPAFAPRERLAQFPPTVICVGDVDPLIDDSTYMYDQLESVGVHVILRIYRALPHGFLNLPTQLPKAVGAIRAAGVYMDWLFRQSENSS
mmetsp:Transcript_78954/g.118693  ORF Transcript_78954/g.118693 Transcript_78954/m.118693 type:complete len:828 (+) Transcript_78954:898-3381(+)